MITQAGRLTNDLKGLGGRLLDLLYPPRCVNCQKVGGALCSNCISTIQPVPRPICTHCGAPLSSARAACSECRDYPLHITRIRSLAWHEGAIRETIHALKYARRRDAAVPLAQMLAGSLVQSKISFDLITNVPLHESRLRERGYDQSALLAEHTASLARSVYMPTLQRTRATADQIGLNGQARRANVRGAFVATRNNTIQGKTLILIDDVCTTGATLDACAAALFDTGAARVYGLTVARPRPSF
jgi:ComF family protein